MDGDRPDRKTDLKVEIIIVSVDGRVEGHDKLVKTLGLTVPVLWDQEHKFAEHYQPTGMP